MSSLVKGKKKTDEEDADAKVSVKERQSKLTQRLSVSYVTDKQGVKKASSFDLTGGSGKSKNWKKLGTATKLMSAFGKGKKMKNTGLDFQLLPPPEESMEMNEAVLRSSLNRRKEDDLMSASATGRLESSPGFSRRGSGSNNGPGGRRVSMAVESRLKELAQRFHAGDDSMSNTIEEEEAVITPAPPEKIFERAKKRMSTTMQHNRFVEEDETPPDLKKMDAKASARAKLQIAKLSKTKKSTQM